MEHNLSYSLSNFLKQVNNIKQQLKFDFKPYRFRRPGAKPLLYTVKIISCE